MGCNKLHSFQKGESGFNVVWISVKDGCEPSASLPHNPKKVTLLTWYDRDCFKLDFYHITRWLSWERAQQQVGAGISLSKAKVGNGYRE